MRLEARSPNCFSSIYVLKLNDRPHGEFSGRWLSEGIDVRLVGRHRLHLEKVGWLSSRLVLVDAATGARLGEADRAGFLTSTWELALRTGPAEMVSAGFFNTGYHVRRGGRIVATAERVGFCEGGWCVQDDGSLDHSDLIFVGLIYHTILQRRRRSSSADGAAAGG